ncbi:hypothetical protein ABGT15_07505 [Flavobacterium enshiense]|uniref:hypothetical protein n=1 Tax=Flavobacterium enshiense TaxID=1341165 RepID=UPI00345DAD51
MKKILFILFVSLICLNVFSQTEETKPVEKKWVAKLNATALIDGFSFPTIQFAVERKLGSYFSVQTEAGIQAYNINRRVADTLSVNTSGFRLMTEGRFYIFKYLKKDQSKTRRADGFYTGIQLFYRKNSYNERQYYYHDEISSENYENRLTDDFGIKKEGYGMSLCIGHQIPFNNFIIEPYTYIGFLKRKIKNFDESYNENLGHVLDDIDNHPTVRDFDDESDSGTLENIAIGIRIGYKF